MALDPETAAIEAEKLRSAIASAQKTLSKLDDLASTVRKNHPEVADRIRRNLPFEDEYNNDMYRGDDNTYAR